MTDVAALPPDPLAREVWVILGASSAVARAFARGVAPDADLLLCGRDMDDLERMAGDLRVRHDCRAEAVNFNATDYDSHCGLVERAAAFAGRGRLNLFIAFGDMPEQTEIDNDFALARRTVETNYLGAVSVLSRFAPRLEAQGGGSAVVLGSVAGDRGRLKNYVYGSAKAGLHAYVQGYRARMHRAGVHVMTVKPGFLDTAMTWSLGKLPMAMQPDAFAATIMKHLKAKRDVVYVPWPWLGIMTIIRTVPERVFKRTNI